jgi:hypothetical protein
MPRDTFDIYLQFTGGRDRYMPDDSVPVNRPGELFGLHESDVASWNAGVNVHPTDVVAFGANYGRERYSSLQLSRNANPPPDPTWTDPSRNWTLDNGASTSICSPWKTRTSASAMTTATRTTVSCTAGRASPRSPR